MTTKDISTHTLTWSVTRQNHVKRRKRKFQLTRSRGAWLPKIMLYVALVFISTHTLTWSVTTNSIRRSRPYEISTHTLTWSVTYTTGAGTAIVFNFNSHAHVERDNILSSIIRDRDGFQLTRSRGAWPYDNTADFVNQNISTHTLTWSVTRICTAIRYAPHAISTHTLTWSVTEFLVFPLKYAWFQLTRSRGAWPDFII